MASNTTTTSNTETNRALIQEYISAINARSFSKLADFWDPQGNYWISGNKPQVFYAGDGNVLDRLATIPQVLGRFDEFSFSVKKMIVEGDHAMVEGEVSGSGPGKVRYRNDVVMVFTMSEGKIVEKREYLDFENVKASFESQADMMGTPKSD